MDLENRKSTDLRAHKELLNFELRSDFLLFILRGGGTEWTFTPFSPLLN